MKKITFAILIAVLFNTVNAINYYAFESKEGNPGEHDVKYSEIKWFNSYLQQARPLKGVPGKNDMVFIRGGDIVTIDQDLIIKNLELEGSNLFEVDGKNCQVSFVQSFLPYSTTTTTMSVKKGGTLTIKNFAAKVRGGIMRNCNYGKSTLEANGGTINVLGVLSFMNESMGEPKELDEPGGIGIMLEGKSVCNLRGGYVLDPIISSNPEMFESVFSFKDRDGDLPVINLFSSKIDLLNTRIKVRINSKTKAGQYPLIIMNGGGKIGGDFKNVTINNKKVTIDGDALELYGKKVSLIWGAAQNSKDKNTKNDLILEVKDK